MKVEQPSDITVTKTVSNLPSWVTLSTATTPSDVAFLSGAALMHFGAVHMTTGFPTALLQDRMALSAAEVLVISMGRPERMPDIRDAVHLLRPGDQAGPAGAVLIKWRKALRHQSNSQTLESIFGHPQPQIKEWMDHGPRAPIPKAAAVIEAVMEAAPRSRQLALILGDAVLCKQLKWTVTLPILANGLRTRDLTKRGEELEAACHRAVVGAVQTTMPLAADLHRRSQRLKEVAPKLRAKGAAKAVELFLSNDAAMPSALPLPDRAARRLCDRLVSLGAVQELSGRDSFRIYGL